MTKDMYYKLLNSSKEILEDINKGYVSYNMSNDAKFINDYLSFELSEKPKIDGFKRLFVIETGFFNIKDTVYYESKTYSDCLFDYVYDKLGYNKDLDSVRFFETEIINEMNPRDVYLENAEEFKAYINKNCMGGRGGLLYNPVLEFARINDYDEVYIISDTAAERELIIPDNVKKLVFLYTGGKSFEEYYTYNNIEQRPLGDL